MKRKTITAYDASHPPALAAICRKLRTEIDAALPRATSKVWHGAPVWFLGETPVAGYDVTAKGDVTLLFWNGQEFDEPGLQPMGKFSAAQVRYAKAADVDAAPLRRWLKEAKTKLWDVGVLRKLRERALAKKRGAR